MSRRVRADLITGAYLVTLVLLVVVTAAVWH
jgi:hypothetical protein